MKSKSLLLTILLLTATAHAQQFRVNQVKGNKAIIEMLGGDLLNPGETYSIQSEDYSQQITNQKNAIKKNQRHNLIALSLSILSSKTDLSNSNTQTVMDINARYGWNKATFEYGVIGLFGYTDSTSLKTTSFGAGGFATYNLSDNKPGADLIFAIDSSLTYAIRKSTTSSTSYDDTYMTAAVGPFAKWFALSNDFNINAGLVYSYTAYKAGLQGATSYNTNTFAISAGIANYF